MAKKNNRIVTKVSKIKVFFAVTLIIILLLFFFELYYINKYLSLEDHENKQRYASFFRYDKVLGWALLPNISSNSEYRSRIPFTVSTNSKGFRDIEHTRETDKFKVLILGDSFAWGYGVNDNEVFSYLLNKESTDIEIFNCGVSGYSTDQELIFLTTKGLKLSPDLVFLFFCSNDFVANMAVSDFGYPKPYFKVHKNKLIRYEANPSTLLLDKDNIFKLLYPPGLHWYQRSYFLNYLYTMVFIRPGYYSGLIPSGAKNSITKRLLLEIIRTTKTNNIPLMVIFVDQDNAPLKKWLKKYSIPSVFVGDWLSDFSDKDTYIQDPNLSGHWRPEVHRIVAERIEKIVEKYYAN